MSVDIDTVIQTREGVLLYPNEAAAFLAANPPNSTDPVITDEVLATRAGCLRFPQEAADYILALSVSSSSS